LIVIVENIVSCFIVAQYVDKHAFKFTIQTVPGKWHSSNDRPTGADRRELRWSERKAPENF